LLLFAEAGVDSAVLEVGLGGRFDATNIVSPALSLITGVALDHTAVLGGTLREIAGEKAGILRPGVPAWTGAEGEALDRLEEAAAARGARLRALAREVPVEVIDRGWDGLELAIALPSAPVRVRTPLVGAHQARNVALALAGAAELGVPPEAAARAAAATRWPGRLERLAVDGGWLVLDGAHNPEAAAALARALERLEGRVPVLVLGMSADKDVAGVIGPLLSVAERVVATRAASSPRALAAPRLAAAMPHAVAIDDVREALAAARRWAGPGGTVVVAGSLFLVGEARALALAEPAEGRERWQ
ncbi:MAG TPA: cyanophycin synthetase, partial [Trueperaceae bacterium]|nr:cyanophycin synthetase [Trueperaceae bacterium]